MLTRCDTAGVTYDRGLWRSDAASRRCVTSQPEELTKLTELRSPFFEEFLRVCSWCRKLSAGDECSSLAVPIDISSRARAPCGTSCSPTLRSRHMLLRRPSANCGELDSGISEDEPAWIVMACSCGAHLARRIEEAFFRSLSSRTRKREPRIRVVRGVLQVQVAVGLSPIGRPDDID